MAESRKRFGQPIGEQDGGSKKRFHRTDEPLLKVLIPNVIAGHLLGKGGSNLAELSNKYGGHIRLSGNKEYFPGTDERVVIINGAISEIVSLSKFIMDKTANPGREQLREGRGEMAKIVVTNDSAGLLIGKRGATMKKITDQSGAKIMIADSIGDAVHGDRVLTVRGTAEQREEAVRQIIEKIAEEPSNMMNTRTKFKDVYIPPPDADRRGGDSGGGRSGYRDGYYEERRDNEMYNDVPSRDRRDSYHNHNSGSSRDQDRDLFLSQPMRSNSSYQEYPDTSSILGLIETAAAALDKQQILSALTGASMGASTTSQSNSRRPSSNKTLPYTLELKVEVPSQKIGHLMGKGGKTVKDMVRQSNGAKFAFEDAVKHDSTQGEASTRTVTVSGTMDQVTRAFDVIHDKVDEFDQYRREVFKPREY